MISTRDMMNYLKTGIERWATKNRDVDDKGYQRMIEDRTNMIRKEGSEMYKSNFFDHNYHLGCGGCNPNFYPQNFGNCNTSVHPQNVMNTHLPIAGCVVNHPIPAPVVIEKPVVLERPVMAEPMRTATDPVIMQPNLPNNRFGYGYSGLNNTYAYPFHRSTMNPSTMQPWHNRYYDAGGVNRLPNAQ